MFVSLSPWLGERKAGRDYQLWETPTSTKHSLAREGGVTVEELKAYCKENFTGYKVPKHIVLKDALPMTPVGKILRRELRETA